MTQHYTTSQMLMMHLRGLDNATTLGLQYVANEVIKDIDREVSILNSYTYDAGRESTMTTKPQNTTEQEFDLYYDRYFDDIEGHIEMLTIKLSITEDDSEHADDLKERIAHLKERMAAGDAYVDNDISASPDAWKTLATFTEAEARAKYQEWDN